MTAHRGWGGDLAVFWPGQGRHALDRMPLTAPPPPGSRHVVLLTIDPLSKRSNTYYVTTNIPLDLLWQKRTIEI
jgi:hypothetical protein